MVLLKSIIFYICHRTYSYFCTVQTNIFLACKSQNHIFFFILNAVANLKSCNMHNILSRNIAFSSWNRNVIFPNQECSKTIYLFSLHYHFKSIAAEWRRLCRTDLQKPSLSYRNNLLEIFCRPILARYLWFSDRLLRILGF